MTIQIRRKPEDRLLELGGGSNPVVHPKFLGGNDVAVDMRACVNAEGQSTVDFVCDFNEPLPIQSNEFDGVISIFALEHISYMKTRQFLSEMVRVVKPGGKIVCVVPNTEAQLKWVLEHPEGWDGKDLFLSASCKLFGDQQHSAREGESNPQIDSHKAFFSPAVVMELFQGAGLVNIVTQPYGERATDLCVEAIKPAGESVEVSTDAPQTSQEAFFHPEGQFVPSQPEQLSEGQIPASVGQSKNYPRTTEERQKTYNKAYFDSYKSGGFNWNYPFHATIIKKVLERNPESVIDLGCGRGYVLKGLEDAGVRVQGVDISKHACMTKVCAPILERDLINPWSSINKFPDKPFDLALSINFWEHIPNKFLLPVVDEMHRTSLRGLHAIIEQDDGMDQTRVNYKTKAEWQQILGKDHEVVTFQELISGDVPEDLFYPTMPGKCLNIGSAWTMYHHGWENLDIMDLKDFARANRYRFTQVDARNGLPYKTGECSLILLSHVLEHLPYDQGLTLLRECRRVLRPDGGLRIIVPDARALLCSYGVTQQHPSADLNDFRYSDLNLMGFAEINPNVSKDSTNIKNLWHLLLDGHLSMYDEGTLSHFLREAGFNPHPTTFRKTEVAPIKQLLRDTTEQEYGGLSLFCDAIPRLG